MRTLFWILFALLLLVRVPSLVQPAGADQGLYAYIGERILAGEVPYRDAWDQKPPGIHFTYALLYALHPDLSVVPAADLVIAAASAVMILLLGRRIGPPGTGEVAALLFLLYTNPALARLGGARIRAQCEVFIALLATTGLWLLHRAGERYARSTDALHRRTGAATSAVMLALIAGLCFGAAFIYKYNAGIYLIVGLAGAWLWTCEQAYERTQILLGSDAPGLRSRADDLAVERQLPLGTSAAASPSDPWDLPLTNQPLARPATAAPAPPAPSTGAVQAEAQTPHETAEEDPLDLFRAQHEDEERTGPVLRRRVGRATMVEREARATENEAVPAPAPAPVSAPTPAPSPALPSARRALTLASTIPLLLWIIVGFSAMVALLIAYFAAHGALRDLYDATIAYNLFYSGETYTSRLDMLRYLVTFPVQHARVEALWFLGGLGTLVLIATSLRHPSRLVFPLWIAAACISIAVNGGRGLPQYFLQAGPALALSAGMALVIIWRHTHLIIRLALLILVTIGAWRVQDFSKAVDYTAHDLRYISGEIPRDEYLARFGGRASDDKYSALAVEELARYLSANVPANERVLHFGFSQGALAQAHRISATRFFWSRPVIVGFKADTPGYGPEGLLAELERTRPYEVILQRRDWDPDSLDSATYFLREPSLSAWLHARYAPGREMGNFLLYRRADVAPRAPAVPGDSDDSDDSSEPAEPSAPVSGAPPRP